MAQILRFPAQKLQPLSVRSGQKHRIVVEVVDRTRPRLTRLILQYAVQNAGSFSALKGLKDAAVSKGYKHRFEIGRTALLSRFVAETADLVSDGLVVIKVDGALVQPRIRRKA